MDLLLFAGYRPRQDTLKRESPIPLRPFLSAILFILWPKEITGRKNGKDTILKKSFKEKERERKVPPFFTPDFQLVPLKSTGEKRGGTLRSISLFFRLALFPSSHD